MVGDYYSFWWKITSGGPSRNYDFPTAIIELNAATGEDYIKETKETVLGSSGHALELKVRGSPSTRNLKIVLIENDPTCYHHLKNVIKKRWTNIFIQEAEGPITSNSSNIYLLNKNLDEALKVIEEINTRTRMLNALYFFDPLRSVNYTTIESVARSRMHAFFQTGTEFFIFVFTSDWFLGRDDLSPLPCTSQKDNWTPQELSTVSQADELFGNVNWRNEILTHDSIFHKEQKLIELYRERLHRWFRYVLPLPFNPKRNQIFHLILCSNYEAGVRATRDFYCHKTNNPKYSPDNAKAVTRFKALHPELWIQLTGNERPLNWKVLWKTVKDHEEGLCDSYCRDLMDEVRDPFFLAEILDWLEEKGYLKPYSVPIAWKAAVKRYILNWKILKERLDIDGPSLLIPLHSGET